MNALRVLTCTRGSGGGGGGDRVGCRISGGASIEKVVDGVRSAFAHIFAGSVSPFLVAFALAVLVVINLGP